MLVRDIKNASFQAIKDCPLCFDSYHSCDINSKESRKNWDPCTIWRIRETDKIDSLYCWNKDVSIFLYPAPILLKIFQDEKSFDVVIGENFETDDLEKIRILC